jgi:hypothetical protein
VVGKEQQLLLHITMLQYHGATRKNWWRCFGVSYERQVRWGPSEVESIEGLGFRFYLNPAHGSLKKWRALKTVCLRQLCGPAAGGWTTVLCSSLRDMGWWYYQESRVC